ncbi:DNA-binding transcriptional regulator [Aeromonas sp. BIGb0445]|uniref:helix-turn-helix domain-containing protein n=1 Tax=Aeromonas sp. BIGb0445 TaxID=2940593 RepID=UPI00216723BC|nr:helix-turn-helix transcriptional regulator [Aeromonas sp. BIGb0445]MCS3461636.1 DNA-binding transcriptional regulator YiaG [Aeromonas sp. BIGb0445]
MNAQPTQINLLNHHAAKRLRQLRERLALSRPKFADQLGIPPTTLKNYELGYREIGGGLFLLMAQHPELKQHTDWLLTGQAPATTVQEEA